MKRRKIDADKFSYTSIINAYNKGREFEECMRYYQEFRMNGGELDRALCGIMVGVFSKCNMIDELLQLLQDMKSEGVKLDERLYKSALNALRDAALHHQSKPPAKLLQDLSFLYGFSGFTRSSKLLTLARDVNDWDFPWKCFESPVFNEGSCVSREDMSKRGDDVPSSKNSEEEEEQVIELLENSSSEKEEEEEDDDEETD
ncbi:hypothetical protein J5N97_021865 [Dioscorea zingiberensis]|uniref:Pentatricopeptide repeat-containing protein n=1 Tax=Dioscorea zingiberensis TaxID=325984 RepID=A0A9D5HAG1_9LILI|nr:hypothetical protein J5N97_021865 [Dioscorea zingiberensis]